MILLIFKIKSININNILIYGLEKSEDIKIILKKSNQHKEPSKKKLSICLNLKTFFMQKEPEEDENYKNTVFLLNHLYLHILFDQ